VSAARSAALLTYDLASGTNGGTNVAATWTKRPINTEVYDPEGIVTLNTTTNQFTLVAGTYELSSSQVFYSHQGITMSTRGRIRNTSDTTTAALGTTARGHQAAGSSANFESEIPPTQITLSATKTFELQYWAESVITTFGLGSAFSTGESERFAWVFIRKI
jgi:hypothetical protein